MNALARLRGGDAVYGVFQTHPDTGFAETAVWCGYDFVIIDCEHGVVDEAAQLNVLRVLSASDVFSLVRVRSQDHSAVARYLDFGADGVMVPDVRTPEQARQIATAACGRWTVGLRIDHYGLIESSERHKPLVVVLIESAEGVANIEDILAVEGIDGLIVGTGDLSTDLKAPGDFTAPAFLSAVEHVETAARARGKILGAKPDKLSPLRVLFDRGYRLLILGRDTALIKSALTLTLSASKSSLPAT